MSSPGRRSATRRWSSSGSPKCMKRPPLHVPIAVWVGCAIGLDGTTGGMTPLPRFSASQLREPIVLAPMGGGPSTPELAGAGTAVWVTATTVEEAVAAAAGGADALVVQGVEAGGHRGSFQDERPGDIGLLALLQLVGAAADLPLVATGGIMTGRGVAAVLTA